MNQAQFANPQFGSTSPRRRLGRIAMTVALVLALTMASCGGESGFSDGCNWDEVRWDQFNWC